jgi:hypothetical protein
MLTFFFPCPRRRPHAALLFILLYLSANGRTQDGNLFADLQKGGSTQSQAERAGADFSRAAEDTSQFLSAKEMEEQYALARSALKSRDWVQALVALEMVLAADANYRDANDLLLAARRGLEQDSTEARLARLYVQGMRAKREGDLNQARQALRTLAQTQGDFRDVAAQLAEVEREAEAALRTEVQSAVLEVPADSLHTMARIAVARQDWRKATALYSELEALEPENLALRKEAEKARVNLLIAQTGLARVEARSGERLRLQMALFIGCIFLLLVLLALAFSFQLRVRYFLLRGRLRRAAQLYESALLRAPQNFKLYPPLADLYLRTQRTDPAALKVLKTIQHLNLPTPHRAAIDAFVAQTSPNASLASAKNLQTPEAIARAERENNEAPQNKAQAQ